MPYASKARQTARLPPCLNIFCRIHEPGSRCLGTAFSTPPALRHRAVSALPQVWRTQALCQCRSVFSRVAWRECRNSGCEYGCQSADCAASNTAQHGTVMAHGCKARTRTQPCLACSTGSRHTQPGEQFADSFTGSREGPGKHDAQAVDFEEAASYQPSLVAISSYKLTAARCGSRQAGLCSATAFGVDEALLPMALSRDIGLETNARSPLSLLAGSLPPRCLRWWCQRCMCRGLERTKR